jgi:hypothetical protein
MNLPLEALSKEDNCVVCYESLSEMASDLLEESKRDAKVAIQCQGCASTQCMSCITEWAVQTIN